jgi:membrane protease YdiL (CAAX protease family)
MDLIFASALIGYHRIEGHPLTWQEFSKQMRYPHIKGKDLLWGFVIFVVGNISLGAFSWLSLQVINAGMIPLPDGLPALVNPQLRTTNETLNHAAGGQISGQWSVIFFALVTHFFNIFGEELWWRGYILYRYELAFGRYTWLVHGLIWAGFHVFKWWDLLALVPVYLLAAFSAQKLKNNWSAFIGHTLTNFFMIPLWDHG